MEAIIKLLKNLGLSDKESATYLDLVESGPSLIATIAHRTGFHRADLYKILPHLIERGLVTVAPRGKQKRYVAESPSRLEDIFNAIKTDFDKLLPQLNELYDQPSQRPVVKFFEGAKGVTSVFEDLLTTLKRGGIYYRYSSRRAGVEVEKYAPSNFRPRRDAKQIERYMISDGLTDHQKKHPTLNRAVKIIPEGKSLFNDNIIMLIYSDRVVIADLDSVSAILVENKTIAEFQKKIFKLLFELL